MPKRSVIARPFSVFWLELLLVLAWLGYLTHSHLRMAAPSEKASGSLELLSAAGESGGAEWMSVYLEGQKIGCGFSDVVKHSEGYRIQERSYLKLHAFNQDKDVITVMIANTDARHRMKDFDFVLSAPPSHVHVRGRLEHLRMRLEIDTAGEVRQEDVELKEVPELSVTFKDRLLEKRPQVGDTLEMPYFDPASLSQQTLSLRVVSSGEVTLSGQKVPTLNLEASVHGVTTTSVVTLDGRTLEETNALGMRLVREPREQALFSGWTRAGAPVDIIALSAVPVDARLERARELTYLHVVLSGGGVEVLLHGDESSSQTGEIEVRIPKRSEWQSYTLPMVDSRFQAELSANALVQKDDPEVRKIASSIVGDVTQADEAAALLNAWVHERLVKEPVVGIPSALEILAMGKGDCNEHTTLFTALSRAMGIPTRMVAGVVYSEEITGAPAFYYHAWPEVYLSEWVPIDPTFGQFPADATHIALVRGELADQMAIVRVVGNLKIDVRDYK